MNAADSLHVVRTLIGIATLTCLPPAVTATAFTAKYLLEGWISGNELRTKLGKDRASALERTLQGCIDRHLAALDPLDDTRDPGLLLRDMIDIAAPASAPIVGLRFDPAALHAELLRAVQAADNAADYAAPALRTLFRRVTTEVFETLRTDADFFALLTPQLWQEALRTLDEVLFLVRELHQVKQTTVPQDTIIAIARKIAPQTGDTAQALIELENAVDIAARLQARGEAGSNTDAFVDTVLRRLAELTRKGDLDLALAEADAAVRQAEDRLQRETQGFDAVLTAATDQHLLAFDAAGAADKIARRVAATPNNRPLFEALRAEFITWYDRGRDKGVNLDHAVAIELAGIAGAHAASPGERGTVLNDKATALAILGERQAGTERLTQAVAAFRDALKERTRDRVPLNWAMTQMNLGNVLQALGDREAGAERLTQAVAAYRDALKEYTRDRAPLDWATTQMNLGNALRTLGAREAGTERLSEAVAAFRDALLEYTRDRVPLDWAMTQGNLGNVALAFFDKTGDPAHLDTAAAHVQAAREVFEAAGASHYLEMADAQLAEISARRP